MPDLHSATRGWTVRDWIASAICVAAAAGFMMAWLHPFGGVAAFDIYSYYLPNMLYARDRIAAGGSGLLWNAFQNCGQPFFGISSTGMLYPSNLLFLLVDSNLALRLVIAGNFVIAGVSMYLLTRELGVGRGAALCGALAFELGTATVFLSAWGPQMSGPHVWTPAALLFCERLLRAPSARGAVGLGVVLMLALLPGFPQSVFFTYQIIALRVLVELISRRLAHPWVTTAWIGVGLALAPLLDAMQLIPAVEMAASSVRGKALSAQELSGLGVITWKTVMDGLAFRYDQATPLVFVPCLLASAAWLRPKTRRIAIAYGVIGTLFFVLAFGTATPLFALYIRLPMVALFRDPPRFTWVASFCLAVLAALGADALARAAGRRALWAASCIVIALAAFALAANGLRFLEWALVGLIAASLLLSGYGAAARRAGSALLVAASIVNLLGYGSALYPRSVNRFAMRALPLSILLPSNDVLFTYRDLFDSLRRRMTTQDRVYIVHDHPSFGLMPKSASLFAVPSIHDYEPQPTRRSAEFKVFLQSGLPLQNLHQYYNWLYKNFLPWFKKPLLDLAAGRYVIVDRGVDNSADVVRPALSPLDASSDRALTVYENRQALPRASYVPALSVLPDPVETLRRLSADGHDPRTVAFVEADPPGGFLGEAGGAAGTADILVDQPEHVVVRVEAPARGFLHLADQYFPGWLATVNGTPTEILRANYLFRVVEVPAGESTVEFRYAPRSVRIGAATTAATLLVLMAAAVFTRRRALHAVAPPLPSAAVRRSAADDRLAPHLPACHNAPPRGESAC